MQDDWALYGEEINRIQLQPSQVPEPKVNGSTHENGMFTSSALARLKFAAVNDRIEELEERLAQERDVIPGMITTGTCWGVSTR